MADLVIRGGTVVDGTGAAPFVGDVAVADGKIVAVGRELGVRGKEEFDARGQFVLPGWIDPHTHFDAQWSWDPYLSPCCAAGVTTCIMGNCGVGFAPCQADRRGFLAELMEAVEDIPGRVIEHGLKYDFETFEEYMDSIERKELGCDVAVMVGHSAVRTWVMGRRASLADRPGGARDNPVRPHEIDAMAAIVRDAVAAGALGFSTSRLLVHRDPKGTLTPGALAGSAEVKEMARAIAEGGGGIFEMSTDWSSYDDVAYTKLDQGKVKDYQTKEASWMVDVARKYGDKVAFSYNVIPHAAAGGAFGGGVGADTIDRINRAGGLAKGQSFLRIQGFLFAFGARFHPFVICPAFGKVAQECKKAGVAELLARLRDPDVRAEILQQASRVFNPKDPKKVPQAMMQFTMLVRPWTHCFLWTPGYEPDPEKESIAALARQEGKAPLEAAYDFLAAGGILWKPQGGDMIYNGDMQRMYEFFKHPAMIPGFGDAGAHGTMIQDGVAATHGLTHWVRDRTRGPRMPIEQVVRKQTADVARLFGLPDRGVLAPGKKADLNVVDLSRLQVKKPRMVRDLPLGKDQRWTQDVEGYVLTLVSGRATFRGGAPTGALPGRLVRNPRRDAAAWRGVSAKYSAPFDGALPPPEDEERVLDGLGGKGGSAAARVLSTVAEGAKSRL